MKLYTLFEKSLDIKVLSRDNRRYEYLFFDVPTGLTILEVCYRVDGDARVDLGLFEETSSSSRPKISSFRGWSGSDRRCVVAGRELSTPGYVCRPINQGRWAIALGFPDEGKEVHVHVEVRASSSEEVIAGLDAPILKGGIANLPADLEAARDAVQKIPGVPIYRELPGHRLGMLCGDFHTHSWHSGDAKTPVVEMVAAAETRRMDFLAITDHNTNAHWAEIDAVQPYTSVALIKGQEVTTYYGHFNAFLPGRLVDFRIENDKDLSDALEEMDHSSGLLSINHPKAIGPQWKLSYHERFDALEAWQAPWLWFNNESTRKWEELLRCGRRITAIGGSDVHDLRAMPVHQYGCPATWVYSPSDRSPSGILEAVRRGAVSVTATPDSAIVVLERRVGNDSSEGWIPAMGREISAEESLRARVLGGLGRLVLRVVGQNGRAKEWICVDGDGEFLLENPAEFGEWLRLEAWGKGVYIPGPFGLSESTLVSFSNPVFIAIDR
ncbi:MAG: hypothetical protein C4319_00625 [Acidimicrobiia bacterium]